MRDYFAKLTFDSLGTLGEDLGAGLLWDDSRESTELKLEQSFEGPSFILQEQQQIL